MGVILPKNAVRLKKPVKILPLRFSISIPLSFIFAIANND